jgi:tetratricopeptide (TPR) repeat protein
MRGIQVSNYTLKGVVVRIFVTTSFRVWSLALIVIIFSSSFVLVQAQLNGYAKIDSLVKELPKMKLDTNAVNLLTDLTSEYYNIDIEKGINYGEKGLILAQKLDWKFGKAKCYNNLGLIYFRKNNYPKAFDYYFKALKLNDELGNKKGIAGNLNNIGNIYDAQTNYHVALDYYFKALKINEEINNKNWITINLGNIGSIYNSQSNYPKALEYFFKALKICEQLGDKVGIASNLGNIGSIYRYQSNFTKALEYDFKALKIFESIGDKIGTAGNLNNIGNIYLDQSNYPKALEYYLKSLKINEELNDKSEIAINLVNIGIIFKKQSNAPKSLEYFLKSLKIFEELGNKKGIAFNLGNIGELYFKFTHDSIIDKSEYNIQHIAGKEKNLNKSIEYLNQSIIIYSEIGELNEQSKFIQTLSQVYEQKGDYNKAFDAFKKHKKLQDSIFSLDRQKEIAIIESKRENEIKDAEIMILQTQKKAQQFQTYLLIGGIIVLLGAFGVAYLRFREKKKLSDKLAIQNAEIENQKKIVELQKSELEEKNYAIVDSINYSATIQNALLPWSSVLNRSFKEHFIIYKPKDIVSGDSYWFQEVDGIKYLAVIDCTGHGVPGSMLTVIANSVLDDAVLSKKLISTSEILTYMNEKVTEVLNQRLAENSIRDGMEVGLIAIHNDKIQFSGAGRPLYLKSRTIEIIKTDKRGIAGQTENDEYEFSSVVIEKNENMLLYLTSDGFADQMNESSKKYSTKRFIETLDKISELPIEKQKEILENEFNSHRGNREQIDDITVLGVKL